MHYVVHITQRTHAQRVTTSFAATRGEITYERLLQHVGATTASASDSMSNSEAAAASSATAASVTRSAASSSSSSSVSSQSFQYVDDEGEWIGVSSQRDVEPMLDAADHMAAAAAEAEAPENYEDAVDHSALPYMTQEVAGFPLLAKVARGKEVCDEDGAVVLARDTTHLRLLASKQEHFGRQQVSAQRHPYRQPPTCQRCTFALICLLLGHRGPRSLRSSLASYLLCMLVRRYHPRSNETNPWTRALPTTTKMTSCPSLPRRPSNPR
jgi:hypothetical protein